MVSELPKTIVDERVHFELRRANHDVSKLELEQSRTLTPVQGPGKNPPSVSKQEIPRTEFLRKSAARFSKALSVCVQAEAARATGFLVVPVFIGSGALLYLSMPSEPDFSAILLALALTALTLTFTTNGRVPRVLAVTSLLFVLGLSAAKLETWRAETTMLGSAVTTKVSGPVLAIEKMNDGRFRLTISVAKTETPKLRYQPETIRITSRIVPDELQPGVYVSGIARLFPARGPLAPDAYDFGFENYFGRVGASGFLLGEPKIINIHPENTDFSHKARTSIEKSRLAISARIKSTLPGENGDIAAALIVGLKRGIDDDTAEALRRTGLAHILSISGLHMALAAGTVMGVLRLFFACFPEFATRHPVRKYAAMAALAAAFGYLLISGLGIATQRSFIMLAVMLTALLFDRAAITMRNLAIAAIIIILLAPHEIIGPSFQMSFAATAALIAAYAYWSERVANRPAPPRTGPAHAAISLFGRYAAALVVTSLVAGLATMIFAAFHFNRIAPLGLLANLLAMPIVSLLVMPPAVLSVLLMPFDLEALPLKIMGKGIDLVAEIARYFSDRTSGDVIGEVPVAVVTWASLALLAATIATTRLRLLALPLAGAAIAAFVTRDIPAVLISENARLVAVRTETGTLAVNSNRPNKFVIDDWSRRTRVNGVRIPVVEKTAKPGRESFSCSDGLCSIKLQNGDFLAHVKDRESLQMACNFARVVVVSNPAVPGTCSSPEKSNSGITFVTASALARNGTAVIYSNALRRDGGTPGSRAIRPLDVVHAIPILKRPWHRYRAWSRAARGLPER